MDGLHSRETAPISGKQIQKVSKEERLYHFAADRVSIARTLRVNKTTRVAHSIVSTIPYSFELPKGIAPQRDCASLIAISTRLL